MEPLAINASLPVEPAASQAGDFASAAEDGKSFSDALSGLVAKHKGKDDRPDTAEAAAPAVDQTEASPAAIDPASGIAAMMVSLDQAAIHAAENDSGALPSANDLPAETMGASLSAGMMGKTPGIGTGQLSGTADAANMASAGIMESDQIQLLRAGWMKNHDKSGNASESTHRDMPLVGQGGMKPDPLAQVSAARPAESFAMRDTHMRPNARQSSDESALKSLASPREIGNDDRASMKDLAAQPSSNQPASLMSMVSQPGAGFQVDARLIHSSSTDLIAPRVGASGWSEAMGQKIVMMASEHIQQAELKLNPEGLGPMQVVLSLEKGAADVQFLAHDAQVREALQSALPKLQEMLTSAGFSLDKVSIDAGTARNQDNQGSDGQFRQQRRNAEPGDAETAALPLGRVIVQARPGRVDTFA